MKLRSKLYFITAKFLRINYTVLIPVLFAAFILTACPVENFVPQVKMAPPLGLTAVNTNINSINMIQVTFRGFNSESYFSGYNIFISKDVNDAISHTGSAVLRPDGSTNLPTMDVSPSTVQELSYSNYINNSNLPKNIDSGSLIVSNIYYIYVEAYSSRYDQSSNPSEYIGIMFVTN